MTVGYDYLSARARGLLGRLLPPERLRALCGLGGVDELRHDLAATPAYATDVAAPAGVEPSVEGFFQMLERRRARILQVLRDAATGRPRELIDILLSRYDLEVVKAILRRWRGQTASPWAPPVTGLWYLPAPGTLDAGTVQALDAAGSVGALADRLAVTGPGGAALAPVLRGAPTARPADLEDRLDRAWAEDAWARCGDDPDGAVVREVLGWEVDVRNLLAALRSGGEQVRFLPGGRYLRTSLLEAIATGGDRAVAAAWLRPTPYAGALDGDAAAPWRRVERNLERRVLALHRRLLFASDPLGIAPVSYCIAAVQAEVRDLRTIAAGLAAGLLPSLIAEELVSA